MTEPISIREPDPALALNLHRRRDGFAAMREFIGDMLGNRAILPFEHDALIALVDGLARTSPAVAQDRQRYGFVR